MIKQKKKLLNKTEEAVFTADEKKVLRSVKASKIKVIAGGNKIKKKCPLCHGTGTAVYTAPDGTSYTEICSYCEGTGVYPKLTPEEKADMEETVCNCQQEMMG
jgi:DnaJ-class molecular chaperone